ncbi:mRNA splicing protein [Mycoemilia scoparia]|uniref:Pre-mRNA-processing protein 45 n=1 Tax=Mycoemilia scoparia TaxID=417184 RepID=A0A9W8DQR4_9FUNG|nr:mRNA splicing protein [Mycoemilia scoparia]
MSSLSSTTSLVRASEPIAATAPLYGQRKGWVPRTQQDFGDGGAYPEIHVAQYPLGLGRKKNKQGNTLAKKVDADGDVRYDAIARHGHREDRVVHSKFKDLVPLRERADFKDEKAIPDRPDQESINKTTEKTREAIEKILGGKSEASKPKSIKSVDKAPEFIRYTPNQQGDGFNSGARQRIIRISEMPTDPMEPPKFQHKRIPGNPPEPPAPVMHSPPRKVTAEEQKEWYIPPSISNWKNAKGYTIPLDKRLAADGRGLQEVQINNKFAGLSEALIAAERHAREEVRQRAAMQQKLAQKEKEDKEERLRKLAQQAREERAGIYRGQDVESSEPSARNRDETPEDSGSEAESKPDGDSDEEKEARERDKLRKQRQKERERELRLSHMGAETKAKHLAKTESRDISEKIALGLARPTMSKESMFDARLFNQSSGISSGYVDDETFNAYDKPLFNTASRSSIYRPGAGGNSEDFSGKNEERIEKMLSNDRFGTGFKGFKGADDGSAHKRTGPVEFEKEDVFGVDEFLSEAKHGGKRSGHDDRGSASKDSSKRHRG